MKTFTVAFLVIIASFAVAKAAPAHFDLGRLAKADRNFALDSFTAFPWEQVHIFGPYTPAANIQKIVGVPVDFPHGNSEGYCLLVFAKEGKVVEAVEVPRRIADFDSLSLPASFTRADARFVIEVGADGSRKVKKG